MLFSVREPVIYMIIYIHNYPSFDMFMCCSLPSNFQKHQHQLSWARRPKGCPVILEREIFYQEDTTTTTTTTPEGTKLWLFFFPYLGRITPDSRKESRVKYECLDENVTGKVVCQVRKFWFQSRQVCWNMTSTPFMMCCCGCFSDQAIS